MLSVEQCKKHLKNYNYTEEQIKEIGDSLYQLGDILVGEYINKKGGNKSEQDKNAHKESLE